MSVDKQLDCHDTLLINITMLYISNVIPVCRGLFCVLRFKVTEVEVCLADISEVVDQFKLYFLFIML